MQLFTKNFLKTANVDLTLARFRPSEAIMSPESRDLLDQSQRLLEKRDCDQAEFEAGLQNSKRALARSEQMLVQLKDLLAHRGWPASG